MWEALRLPALVAAERVAEAGRRLAAALLDEADQELLAELLNRLPPGDTAEVVLSAIRGGAVAAGGADPAATAGGGEVGPAGAAGRGERGPAAGRAGPERGGAARSAGAAVSGRHRGPLKVLAAVAAPDETKTSNVPLDTEAEMAAVLDAVTGVAADAGAQVRILEVASLPAIRQALAADAYHVLHLSAHGSPDAVELEDEDGAPGRR